MFTAYHLGVSAELRNLNILQPTTTVSGASGGALAAVLAALDGKVADADSLSACTYIAERCRSEGTLGVLRLALDQCLLDLLPKDVHVQLNTRPARAVVAYTQLAGVRSIPHIIDSFHDKEDLIDCLRASCNIPFYFAAPSLTVPVRGHSAIDGFFASERSRFGCPSTGATQHELIICPFRPNVVGLNPHSGDKRMPHATGFTVPFQAIRAAFPMLKNVIGDAPETREPEQHEGEKDNQCQYELLTPALLPADMWPFTLPQLLQLALGPPPLSIGSSEHTYQLLFACGVETVKAWVKIKGEEGLRVFR